MVLELLSDNPITPVQEAQILEKFEAAIYNILQASHKGIESEMYSQDSFDTQLLIGLRLRPE